MIDELSIEFFLELEKIVWEALKTGDAVADAAMLADHFLGVYPSGFAEKSDHFGQLDDGPTVAEYTLTDARMMVLTESVVILSYRATWQRPATPEPDEMYVSSIWQKMDGVWRNVFSQDTPVESL